MGFIFKIPNVTGVYKNTVITIDERTPVFIFSNDETKLKAFLGPKCDDYFSYVFSINDKLELTLHGYVQTKIVLLNNFKLEFLFLKNPIVVKQNFHLRAKLKHRHKVFDRIEDYTYNSLKLRVKNKRVLGFLNKWRISTGKFSEGSNEMSRYTSKTVWVNEVVLEHDIFENIDS